MSKVVGRKLKKAREALRLSIDDIARRTRINKTDLIAIEDGDLQELSGAILRSYIKSYAHIVGEDLNSLLDSLSEEESRPIQRTNFPSRRRGQGQSKLFSSERIHSKVVLDPGDQQPVQVSPFVPKRGFDTLPRQDGYQLERELQGSSLEVAVASEVIVPSRSVSLPMNLPKPEELGIQFDPQQNGAQKELTVPSRSATYKKRFSKEKKDYGRMYTWVLIVSAVLLVVLVLCGIIYTKRSNALDNANALELDKKSVVQVDNKKPVLREMQTGAEVDRYELVYADKMDIRIQGKEGASLFEVREKEVNPPIYKGEVKKSKEFVATYQKSIWLRLHKPSQVEVTVNGQPLKTKAYAGEKDYLITFLQ